MQTNTKSFRVAVSLITRRYKKIDTLSLRIWFICSLHSPSYLSNMYMGWAIIIFAHILRYMIYLYITHIVLSIDSETAKNNSGFMRPMFRHPL